MVKKDKTVCERVPRGELLARLAENRRKTGLRSKLIWISIGIIALGIVVHLISGAGTDELSLGIIIALAGFLMVLFCTFILKSKSDINMMLVQNSVLVPVLEGFFENTEYDVSSRLPDSVITSADMELPAYDKVSGGNHVKGLYRGIPVEMSLITLTKKLERLVENENGDKERVMSDTTVFINMWMTCDLGKPAVTGLFLRIRRPDDERR